MSSGGEATSSSPPPPPPYPRWNHDVFLSFRGEDTRSTFVSHLHHALVNKGINTFIDDNLRRGERISPALIEAIEGSRIAIVVFSRNFASSTWCLDELLKILECRESKGQMVRPVFLRVDPSEMRKQTGCFAETMRHHEEDFKNCVEKVQRWRDSLTEAANLSGWHHGDGSESELVQKIAEEVSSKLSRPYLSVATYPVGLDLHVQSVNAIIRNGASMVGICGASGIGKTTIAKALYNRIADQFEGSSFVKNVTGTSRVDLVKVQEALLCDVLGDPNIKVAYIHTGLEMIREKLGNKRVLLAFDNVNRIEQLKDLIGEVPCFGSGSRIILTTRDEQVVADLGASLYNVSKLADEEALKLFCWNAFQLPSPAGYFNLVSVCLANLAKGIPLALIVMGSFLSGKSIQEWNRTLNRLKTVTGEESLIRKMLLISVEGLEANERAIFLDIACFFNGGDKDYVTKLLDRCNFYPDNGLKILEEKSLISIEANNIWMHELLQELGRDIVRLESPKHPGRRSRLWYHEDVLQVLTENSGSDSVQGIKLDMLSPEDVFMSTEAFKKMKNLRLVMVRNMHISGYPGHLSYELFPDVHGNVSSKKPWNRVKVLSRKLLSYKLAPIKFTKVISFFTYHVTMSEEQDKDSLQKELMGFRRFSLQELQKATDNFSNQNKLGAGGFGPVYYATLMDGREVAIKREASGQYYFKREEFITEVKILCQLNHKNIVRCLGYLEEGNERAVVLEYMNNKSLFEHLHSLHSYALMSWERRIKVALDVAWGLEYLHFHAVVPVIHRDVKSSNILVDANWNVKVSDFGLSVLLTENNEELLIPRTITGTMGYLAPEYVMSGHLSAKSDVHGFGVVVLELLTGKKALCRDEHGSMTFLVDGVVPSIEEGNIGYVLDQSVPKLPPFEMDAVNEVARLAAECVLQRADCRPPMTEVVSRLKHALKKFSGSQGMEELM